MNCLGLFVPLLLPHFLPQNIFASSSPLSYQEPPSSTTSFPSCSPNDMWLNDQNFGSELRWGETRDSDYDLQ